MRLPTAIGFLVLTLGLGSCSDEGGADAAASPARYEVVMQSSSQRALSRGMLWLYLPVVSSADVDVSAQPDARLIADNLGNRQLSFEVSEVPVGFERALEFTLAPPLQTDESPKLSAMPEGSFLAAEALVEVDDPALQEKGQSLRSFSAQQTAAAVQDFVSTLTPKAPPADGEVADSPPMVEPEIVRGALHTFETGPTDEIDRVLLSVALLRAASLPARVVSGFLDDGDGQLASNEMQLWVEYSDQDVWQPLLPPGTDESTRAIVFRIFSSAQDIDANSLAGNFFRGVGLTVRLLH